MSSWETSPPVRCIPQPKCVKVADDGMAETTASGWGLSDPVQNQFPPSWLGDEKNHKAPYMDNFATGFYLVKAFSPMQSMKHHRIKVQQLPWWKHKDAEKGFVLLFPHEVGAQTTF